MNNEHLKRENQVF